MLSNIPLYILELLKTINKAGYAAYIVGGAVRDILLGTTPHDFDITTDALPEEIKLICKQNNWQVIDNLGNNFGCVVVVVEGHSCEITTMRGERYATTDAHRPSEVWFCKELKEDLSRRDFTINAMALDVKGVLYDYFNGQEDLQHKILRTVGNANQRFREDALRMFRACRFVAQLGFTYIQQDNLLPSFGMAATPYTLPLNFSWPIENCSGLSLERVRAELEKLLVAPYAGKGLMLMVATGLTNQCCRVKENGQFQAIPILPELDHLVGLAQNKRFHMYDTWEHTLQAIDNSPRDLTIRWTMLLHDVAKGLPGIRGLTPDGHPNDHGHETESAKMTVDILNRFRYNDKFSKRVIWLVAEHMRFAPILFYKHLSTDPQYTDPVNIRKTLLKWLRHEATSGQFHNQMDLLEAFQQLKHVYLADMGATFAGRQPAMMQEGAELADEVITMAKDSMPVANTDLNINGKDLLELITSDQIKEMFKYLLERVQSQNLPNEKTALLNAVQKKLAKLKQ